jgi:hypothetical protein
MRLKLAPIALYALSVLFGAAWTLGTPANAWAKGGKSNSDNGSKKSDEALSRQFKWEEGVVGNNEKKLDREKIAAMQEKARKEDAAHRNEPAKKTERPKGIGVPASSTLPTMDIEKPAPVAAKPKQPRPVAVEPPKRRDSLDQLLDSEKDTPAPRTRKSDGGLGKVLAIGDGGGSSASSDDGGSSHGASSTKAKGKRVAHRR